MDAIAFGSIRGKGIGKMARKSVNDRSAAKAEHTRRYMPRRASQRWLEGAPSFVLDVLDNKGRTADRYTVLMAGRFLYHTTPTGSEAGGETLGNTFVQYLGMSDAPTHPQGISMWGELKAFEAAAYRYREKHRRIRWLDLPEHIRRHVLNRASYDEPFVDGYFEAMAFTNFGPDDEELREKGLSDLSLELYQSSLEDCWAFQKKARALLCEAYEREYDEAQGGRDFWFTRCGHGVGFWDRPQLNEGHMAPSPGGIGERLTNIAQQFGNIDLYAGDDGKVYGA